MKKRPRKCPVCKLKLSSHPVTRMPYCPTHGDYQRTAGYWTWYPAGRKY